VTSLSQALPLGGLLLPHSAFQEHAAHPLEWSRELSSKGSLDTCISKGHSTFSYAAFTAHMGERVDEIAVGVLCQALQGHCAAGGGKGRLIFLYSLVGCFRTHWTTNKVSWGLASSNPP
jgi:hypothetical protein